MAPTSISIPRILRAVPGILILFGAMSCATLVSHENAVDSLRKTRSCCESITQFKYDQLTEADEVSFNLDASSDAFNFQSGKSYFRAFHLPEMPLPYRIRITSWALGEHINKAHIFYPQVVLLDENFGIIWQSAPGDFLLGKAGVGETVSKTWGLPVKLEGSVLIDNPSAKFVLLFTTQELMSHTSPYVTRQVVPIILPGVVTAVPGPEETVFIQHSPFGLLNLEILPVGDDRRR
jgi:hypothetical protein